MAEEPIDPVLLKLVGKLSDAAADNAYGLWRRPIFSTGTATTRALSR